MTRVHPGSRATSRLTRRRVLTVAATVGVGASVAGVAGLGLAGEKAGAKGAGPLVISLRDAKNGTIDVFSGGSRRTVTDPELAERIIAAASR